MYFLKIGNSALYHGQYLFDHIFKESELLRVDARWFAMSSAVLAVLSKL